jgi:Holliday junction resolvase
MRRAAQEDANQKQIVRELRAAGFTVRHTHTIGKGFPDLVVGKNGMNLLVEVKRAGKTLTADEREFFETWQGHVIIATCAEDVVDTFNGVVSE